MELTCQSKGKWCPIDLPLIVMTRFKGLKGISHHLHATCITLFNGFSKHPSAFSFFSSSILFFLSFLRTTGPAVRQSTINGGMCGVVHIINVTWARKRAPIRQSSSADCRKSVIYLQMSLLGKDLAALCSEITLSGRDFHGSFLLLRICCLNIKRMLIPGKIWWIFLSVTTPYTVSPIETASHNEEPQPILNNLPDITVTVPAAADTGQLFLSECLLANFYVNFRKGQTFPECVKMTSL